jgi:hypothetical protein
MVTVRKGWRRIAEATIEVAAEMVDCGPQFLVNQTFRSAII